MKSFYYMDGDKVVGPVYFINIERMVVDELLEKDVHIHPGEGDWIPYCKYVAKHPELPQPKNQLAQDTLTTPLTPAQVCFTLAFILLSIGLIVAVVASNVHMAIGGISSFLFWGIIGLILRASAIQADKRTESIIKAIRDLKEK